MERDSLGGQLPHGRLDVADLEVRNRLADIGLPTPHGHLRPRAGAEADGEGRLLEDGQPKLLPEEMLAAL